MLQAQSDDATLINVTTLDQMNAIRYDLDGDGVVVFTAEDPLLASAGNVDDLAELTRYASQFTGGTYHTRAGGSDTPIANASMTAVVAGTTYVYKLSVIYEGYELMVNLDFNDANSYASNTISITWTTGSGWESIGDNSTNSNDSRFTAIFEGNGHTISNLFIDRSSTNYVGLFGFVSGNSAELRNLGMVDVEVTGSSYVGGLVGRSFRSTVSGSYATGAVTGSSNVGGLVGRIEYGRVSGSYATGAVTGNNGQVGGLVGDNQEGTVSGSYATGTVKNLTGHIGGLVGRNQGDISDSYATGAVTFDEEASTVAGGAIMYIGGLVGENNRGDISNSYATGTVTFEGTRVGGLVGYNYQGTVSGSYATGAVTGSSNVGGLMGRSVEGTISNSYATGVVMGTGDRVGGLVGYNYQSTVSGSYATGAVTGSSNVGGLMGRNFEGTVSNSYATGAVTGSSDVGGLMGSDSGSITITASYYNSETTGRSDVGKGEGKTTAELQTPTGYTDIYGTWDDGPDGTAGSDDDTDYWDFGTNEEYPVLKIDVNGNGISGDPADLPAQRPVLFDADEDGLIEISTLEQLNAIRYDLDGNGEDVTNEAAYSAAFGIRVLAGTITGYELMVNLDFNDASSYASNTINTIWTTGSGWEPIGDNSTNSNDSRFTAIFEGNRHTISNLFIDSSFINNVGFFSYVSEGSAELRNIGLLDVDVTGINNVGSLVGLNSGDISGSYATGSVAGSAQRVGGLVGLNLEGTVLGSYATGAVTGNSYVGGLVGVNLDGMVLGSYATGAMTGNSYVGGLVGQNYQGTVSNSYATGSVTGNSRISGLVGLNLDGMVLGSYATGAVTGSSRVGGLVGLNLDGMVLGSYATGAVTGNSYVGGLVGLNTGSTTITASYYNSQTTRQSDMDKGEGKTTSELLAPTGYMGIYLTWDDDVTDHWDFGTNLQYPVLKIDVNGDGTAGDADDLRAQRPPRLSVGSFSLDFEDVNTASTPGTMTYNLTGANLTGQVDLVIGGTNADLFSVDMPTISPLGEAISGTTVTVTFEPTDAGNSFTAIITHNGGGLTTPVEVNLVGSAVSPSLTFTVQDPLPDGITQNPSGTFDFGDVNTSSTPGRITYDLTGANLTGQVTLDIEGTNANLFSVDMPTISPLGEAISGTTVTVTFEPTDAGNSFTAMITHRGGGLTTPVEVNLMGSAVSPTLTSTESNLDFGDLNIDSTPGTMTYDLTGANLTGEVTLELGGAVPTGTFTISPTGSIAQSSGTVSQMIRVTFNPTAAQTYTAMITHSGDGLTTPLVVSLEGTGTLAPTPTLQATPNSLDFVQVNTASKTPNTMTYNLKGANLTGQVDLVIEGTNANLFSVDMPTISLLGGAIPGTTVTVTFSPTTAGNSFTAIITHSGGGLTPVKVNLMGSAVSPTLTSTESNLNFGDLNIDSTPGTITYNLTGANLTGEVTLELGGAVPTGTFTISPTGSIAQSSGTVSQMIRVTFNPTAAQTYTAMITHSGDGLTTPLVVSLEGTGTLAPTPTLQATPNSLDFVQVNTASKTPNTMTYNLTGANLTGQVDLVIEGTNADLFSVDMPTISPVGNAISGTTVTVTFEPTTAGSFTAMITHSGGGLTPVKVNLMGSAVSPTLTSTESNLNFGDLNIDSTPGTITYDLTGANLTGDVTLELGDSDAGLFTISPTGSIAQSSGTVSQMITVTFNPTAAQTYNAMITHRGGGLTTPLVVSLTGAGTLAPTPTLEATPNSLDFVQVNTASKTPNTMTYNLTGANLTGQVDLVIEGTNADLFSVDMATISLLGGAIPETTVTVTFEPTTAGSFTAMITHSGGGLTPVEVNLAGSAVSPTLTSTESNLNFGDLNIDSTPGTITYDLTGANLTGDVTLELGGSDAGLFTISPTGSIAQSSGTVSQEIRVTFNPTAAQTYNAMITHRGGGLTTPLVVSLTGAGTLAPTPTLEATPNSLDFVQVNTASKTPNTMTYNLTGANLTGQVDLVIEGTNADLFSVDMATISLLGGAISGTTVTVTFSPTDAGNSFTAMITHSGGGLAPVEVNLMGSAVSPTLTSTESNLDFVQVNTASTPGTMTYDLTGANLTGEVALDIEGTNADLFSVDMATISPAGEAISGTTVTVTFRPITAGDSFTAMITHSGGGLSPVVVNLAGSAVSPTLTSTESNLDFGDVSTASTTPNTMTYDLTGANLTEDVTLTIEGTNANLFTISPTGPIAQSSGTVSQMITVTFDPTAAGDSFTAMITHSGGGLTTPLVVSLEGAGVPPVLLGFATRAISNLRLSPNPVTGLLYVQGHGLGDMTVTVRSIAGKVHGSYTIRNTGKVPFSGLPSGMYIVQIVSQTGIVTKQVIKSSGL